MLKRMLLIMIVAVGAYFSFTSRHVNHAPGILIDETPIQTETDLPVPFNHEDFRITPLARFQIRARVLSTERYRLGKSAELSPIDLALGWGPMSDTATLEQLSISQSSRFYFWSAEYLPIPRNEISHNSANMHMIPAEDYVKSRLLEVRVGDIISIDGYLVRAESEGGWYWNSSLTRTDTGNGACELIWVEDIAIITSLFS